ncbi:MAG: DUF1697 domain-containing protein [Verrucomicrobiota bacterium]|nr:DUF1697 domain-containing protein [Verrucomicrobiota bacterium]
MRYIAFLRAINVGKRQVKMARLRQLFEECGLKKVETFIASGNLLFETPSQNEEALRKKIEKHLQASLGFEVVVFLRNKNEMAAIADYRAFTAPETKGKDARVFVGFLSTAPGKEAVASLTSCSDKLNKFRVHGCELYWLARGNILESGFYGPRLEKTIGMRTTLRNINTVQRLAAKLATGPAEL